MSTSFSVASCTEQMTSSVDGLMVSKVLPSTPLTHSLLIQLDSENVSHGCVSATSSERAARGSAGGWGHEQSSGDGELALGRFDLSGQGHGDEIFTVTGSSEGMQRVVKRADGSWEVLLKTMDACVG